MRILFVTPYLPSPPQFGGQRRLDGLMRGVAATHDVSLLSFAAPMTDRDSVERMVATTRGYCSDVVVVRRDLLDRSARRRALTKLRGFVSRHSFDYWIMRDGGFQARLAELLSTRQYDIVQVESSLLAVYDFPRRKRGAPLLVLDEHNIEYDAARRAASFERNSVLRMMGAIDWRKFRREEISAWRRFDGVTLTSARDEAILKCDAPVTPTAVVPNAVDTTTFCRVDEPVRESLLLFFGAMNYPPNAEALLHFVKAIFPRIKAKFPSATVQVVGQYPPPSITALRSAEVEVTGLVDDPRPFLARAAVVIVPVRFGGGTRFKIVEALAMGKAVVSTSIGAEGLDVEHEKHLLLADDDEQFAAQVVRLLSSPDLALRLGMSGSDLIRNRYHWGAAVERLTRFYDELRSPAR